MTHRPLHVVPARGLARVQKPPTELVGTKVLFYHISWPPTLCRPALCDLILQTQSGVSLTKPPWLKLF